jgi:CBS-domain-containing membrane protein
MGEVVTGLLYVDPLATDLHTALNTCDRPLNALETDALCPGAAGARKAERLLALSRAGGTIDVTSGGRTMAERTVFQSISRKHVISLGPQASVRDAACVMTRANCGSVLIMELPDTLLGILTERDLMTRVLAKGSTPTARRCAK